MAGAAIMATNRHGFTTEVSLPALQSRKPNGGAKAPSGYYRPDSMLAVRLEADELSGPVRLRVAHEGERANGPLMSCLPWC